MEITSTNSATSAVLGDTQSRIPVQTLDQDDFLKLIVTQLTTQDPLNPQKDTDFIAQMAQFSSLEQSKTMQQDLAQMRDDQQILQANSMLGRVVTLQDEEGFLTKGTVSAIQMEAGTPRLIVNGLSFSMSDVLSIEPAASNS